MTYNLLAAPPVPPHTRPSNRSYHFPTGRAHVQGPLSRELAAVTERRIPESPLLKTVFRVGQIVPATGIYNVQHTPHRLPVEITLRGNEPFPPCATCKVDVSFTFLRSVAAENFHFSLNSIPPLVDQAPDNPEHPLPNTAVN